jgi:hypothetical protein
MQSDHMTYTKFTTRARLEKSVNSLLGMIEGIAIDGVVNASEIGFLKLWLRDHQEVSSLHPYNELIPVVQMAVADGVLTS